MQTLAEKSDVEERWRPLRGPQEATNAGSWLLDASGMLRTEIPDIDARIAASDSYANLVRGVCAAMVVRVLRGQDSRDAADFSSLYIAKSELAMLDTTTPAAAGRAPTWSFPPIVPLLSEHLP